MVLFIEANGGTVANIQGSGGNTKGNWTTGVTYPIMTTVSPNSSSVVTAYDVKSIPTCYMICAGDKKTKKVDQYTAAQLNTALAACPSVAVAPVANFSASSTNETCTGTVQFSDLSTGNPTSWSWNFGDGTTSTLKSPSHTYTANGTYTVSLQSTNSYGNDIETKTGYVTINLAAGPTTTGAIVCAPGGTATLNVSGSDTYKWYNSATDGTSLYTGNSFTTPYLTSTTTYYVESEVPQAISSVGMTAKTSNGAYYTSTARWAMKFDALAPLTIKTVKVFANSAGNRTIWLANSSGVGIDSVTVNIPSGEQTVTLNLHVPAGTGYMLGAPGACNFWRDASGGTYPYTVSNLISITGNTAGSTASAYYYYFYNWQVQADPCTSLRSPVTATYDNCTGISDYSDGLIKVFPNPNSGEFTITIDNTENLNELSINNVIGQAIYSENLLNNEYEKTFDLSNFPKGIYIIKLSGENINLYKKIIIR